MSDPVAILSRLLREMPDPFSAKSPKAPAAPVPPKLPEVPSAFFTASGQQPGAAAAPGQLSKLAAFAASAANAREAAEAASSGGRPEAAAAHSAVARAADAFGANLQALVFPFFKKALFDDQEKHRERQDSEAQDNADALDAEQQALDILEQVLELADNATDREAFCTWLDERIQTMEWELVTRTGALPQKAEKMIEILRQANEALRFGVSTEHIRNTLRASIEHRKNNANPT